MQIVTVAVQILNRLISLLVHQAELGCLASTRDVGSKNYGDWMLMSKLIERTVEDRIYILLAISLLSTQAAH
jgi:hypothetical protein